MKSCDEGLFPTASGWNDVTRGGSYGKAREARSSAFPESNGTRENRKKGGSSGIRKCGEADGMR